MATISETSSNAVAHHEAGRLAAAQGRPAEAIPHYRRAVALEPGFAQAWDSLATAFGALGRWPEAVRCLQQALTRRPGDAVLHARIGDAWFHSGDAAQAAASYRLSLALEPANAKACANLGLALSDQGDHAGALDSCRRALALEPDFAEARNNLGLTALLLGDLHAGWRDLEAAERLSGQDTAGRKWPLPLWQGESLEQGRILLYADQGIGDALHFIRYVPLVAARCKRIVLLVQPELTRLLQGVAGIEEIAAPGAQLSARCYRSLGSLPFIFDTGLATIPAEVPYIRAEDAAVQAWKRRFTATGLRVGLVWAGSPDHRRDRDRSLPLAALAPLAGIDGIDFYALQKGPAREQGATPPAGMALRDLAPELDDFAATAAAIAALDLVITVDTSIAHLAGALGKPVWILLAASPDWRWLLRREDSPWYPTARLFRQPQAGAWEPVIGQVAAALRHLVRA